MRYSESISYLKAHTAEIIREVAEGKSPYVIIQHGEARDVVQSIQEHEQTQETLELLKILVRGEQEISDGKTITSEEVFSGAEKLIDSSYPGHK